MSKKWGLGTTVHDEQSDQEPVPTDYFMGMVTEPSP